MTPQAAFARILAGWDGRDGAEDPVALARTLADAAGCSLSVAHVEESGEPPELGDALAQAAGRAGGEPELTRGKSVSEALGALAERSGAGLIVVGSSHKGDLGRVVPGSTALRLLHGGKAAVAVAPRGFAEGDDGRLPVLGLAYDGSPDADIALALAIQFAQQLESTMRVIVVNPILPTVQGDAQERRAWYDAKLDHAMAAIPASIRPAGRVETGDPPQVIVEESERGIDLLLMGSRGQGPFQRVLLGSVSGAVIERAACPVLITPRPRAERLD